MQRKISLGFIGMSSDFSLAHLEALREKFKISFVVEATPRNYKGSTVPSGKSSICKYAEAAQIPYCFVKNVSKEAEGFIRENPCDLICVASCAQLIRQNIIDIPPLGIINAHQAKLPNYRGPNPDYWLFYFQEKEATCTIHYIDAGEDTGDIILERPFSIPFGIEKTDYERMLNETSARAMRDAVSMIEAGTAQRIPQVVTPEDTLFRVRNLKPEDHDYRWEEWDVKRAFHFMRGTDCLDLPWQKSCFRVHVTGFREGFEKGTRGIVCKNGVIEYRKQLALKRTAKVILRTVGLYNG